MVELGGGFRPADLAAYFKGLDSAVPSLTAVSVDRAQNAPTGDANGPDGEVMLDIEVIGAIAPQAKIAVYFAPNTDAGFLDAITTAIHDTTNKPSVISISWGGAESTWTSQAMTAMDEAFQAAATLGVTVCVASGDNGSSDGVGDGSDHVDFPASSPFVLACGGTSLRADASAISGESVWNDGAGGWCERQGHQQFSSQCPPWQVALSADQRPGEAVLRPTRRGVPDVSNADPRPVTTYSNDGHQLLPICRRCGWHHFRIAIALTTRSRGTRCRRQCRSGRPVTTYASTALDSAVIGGTSAVAPLWAALIARINQASGTSAGFVNPRLYANPQALRDITSGNNGDFAAAAGWDACTGLGSPNGSAVLRGVI